MDKNFIIIAICLFVFSFFIIEILNSRAIEGTDIDPHWYGTDDFFIELKENYAGPFNGTAIFILHNPLATSISAITPSELNFFIQSNKTPTTFTDISINRSVLHYTNITNYTQVCNPYFNGTHTVQNCSSVLGKPSWFWDNYTAEEFVSLKDLGVITIQPQEYVKVKVEAEWKYSENNYRDWIPFINVAGINYTKFSWQWWNNSLIYRYPIIVNTSSTMVVSVNDTYGIGGTMFWVSQSNTSYVYSNSTPQAGAPLDIGNDVSGNNYYNSTARNSGRNPYSVWDSSTVLVLHFDEGSGKSVFDMNRFLSNGTISSTTKVTYNTTAKYYRALNFSGNANGYITMNNTAELNISKPNITVSAWVLTNKVGDMRIVSKAASGGSPTHYLLKLNISNGLTFMISLANGTLNVGATGAVLSTGIWYHAAAVYDNSTIKVYVNGDLTGTLNGVWGNIAARPEAATIGYLLGNYEYFAGLIDEVRIYNRSLTQAEIRNEYWMGLNNLTMLGKVQQQIPPNYSLNSTNSTAAGTPIEFRLYWQDATTLSKAITSLWNGSAWVNASSWCSLSGTGSWCNQTLVVNSTAQQLWWKQYANDTSNLWNTSQNFSLVTTSAGGSTCVCSSIQAGTAINCAENCDIGTCNVGGIAVIFTSTGTITTSGDVTNILRTNWSPGCKVVIGSGKRWG